MPSFSTGAVVAALAAGLAAAATMPLTKFDSSQPEAVCNDGTPGGYYFRPATSPDAATTWLIHQQGGGWCYDGPSCKARPSSLTSSKGWAADLTVGGIFDSTDPRLANANLVYVPYCTSDAYIGNASTVASSGFQFRGRAIVDAVFDTLITQHGMGAQPGTRVLYSGCSAGARGVLFNTAHISGMLAERLGSNLAHYGSLLDSAFWIDMEPEVSGDPSFASEVQGVFSMANAATTLDPNCLASFPPAQQWKCMMGQYAVPFLSQLSPPASYLLHAFQYDQYQLNHNEGVAVPTTPPQLQYAEEFRNLTRAAAHNDTIGPALPGTAAHMPACYKHCNTETSTFSTLATNGYTLEASVLAWFFDQSQGVLQFNREDCSGFNCGTDCPSV